MSILDDEDTLVNDISFEFYNTIYHKFLEYYMHMHTNEYFKQQLRSDEIISIIKRIVSINGRNINIYNDINRLQPDNFPYMKKYIYNIVINFVSSFILLGNDDIPYRDELIIDSVDNLDMYNNLSPISELRENRNINDKGLLCENNNEKIYFKHDIIINNVDSIYISCFNLLKSIHNNIYVKHFKNVYLNITSGFNSNESRFLKNLNTIIGPSLIDNMNILLSGKFVFSKMNIYINGLDEDTKSIFSNIKGLNINTINISINPSLIINSTAYHMNDKQILAFLGREINKILKDNNKYKKLTINDQVLVL